MFNLIPLPMQYKVNEGECKLTVNTIIATEYGNAQSILEKFLSTLGTGLGVGVNIVKDDTLDTEQYKLNILDSKIVAFVGSDRAAIYAVQSLIQLADEQGNVPLCEITDKPRYAWRAFMLDSARHFWTKEHIKSILDIMSNLKLNIFHWHLTDDQGWRIEIKSRPLLTQKGTKRSSTQLKNLSKFNDDTPYGDGLYYSQEDVKEIVAYAKSLGIDVVPEIDMPGHLIAAISCYPELSCEKVAIDVSNRWGVLDTIGCCGSEELYVFIKEILDEVCTLFPFQYFHIGGDEVPKTKWKKCPRCQEKMAQLDLKNEEELQGYFNNFVGEYIKKYGKNLVGWNEILNATTLDKNTIIQWWTPTGGRDKIMNFINDGGKVILSKHQNFYMDHSYAIRPLKKTYGFNYTMLGITDESCVIGIEAPQWTEYVRDKGKFDFNTFPRMMALAENAWSQQSTNNYLDFEKRLEAKRGFFEGYFDILMANPFFYRGNSVKGAFFKGARSWTTWSKDPNYEYKLSLK